MNALFVLDLDGLAPVLWEEHPVPGSNACFRSVRWLRQR